jgi:DNA-binding LytR/AlgR family response regulator
MKERNIKNRMLINKLGEMVIHHLDQTHWVESVEDYVNLHTLKGSFLIIHSMSNLENKLDPDRFIRVHQSYLVNLDSVKEDHPWSNGRLKCYLKDGKEIILSCSGAKRLKERLQ